MFRLNMTHLIILSHALCWVLARSLLPRHPLARVVGGAKRSGGVLTLLGGKLAIRTPILLTPIAGL